MVEDAHQGRGIGSVLLEHLAEAARENGITRFVAEVLPQNGGMLRVFSDFGYQVQRQYADGVVHLSFPIAPTEKSREVQESREHRTEARSIARLLQPARGRGLRRQRQRPGHRRGHPRATCATAVTPAPIVPVHRGADRVAGLPAYRSAADAGVAVDLALIAVPPDGVAEAVPDAAAAGAGGLVVVSAGFAEAGPRGRGRAARADRDGPRGGHAGGRPELPGDRQHRSGGTAERHARAAAAGGRPGRASSASPARSGWPCWPRRTAAGWACPASCRRATAPTSPATTCCSTGRTTRAPTRCCSTWRRSATRASSPGWPAG